ncbi:MAG: hypothetical protein K9M44_04510 [Candidatus Pacebacteria bacterium]|nr:hypothetical protein [Candidatus Paceibacterota bacterium]
MKKLLLLSLTLVLILSACSLKRAEQKPASSEEPSSKPQEKQIESEYLGFMESIKLKTDENFEIVKIIPYTGSLGSQLNAYRWKWQDNDLYFKYIATISICEEIAEIKENLKGNNINIGIYETNNQERNGAYCNGVRQYLVEFKLNNIEKKDYNLVDIIGKSSRVIKSDIDSNYNQNDVSVENSNKDAVEASQAGNTPSPVIIYKTTGEYYDLVPVVLSQDKSQIVSYPGREDVYKNDILAYPFKMSKDYLFDNRGLGKNSAFLDISYEDYSQMESDPSSEELYEKIIDKDPIVEMYNCRNLDIADNIVELNKLIKRNQLSDCEKIK